MLKTRREKDIEARARRTFSKEFKLGAAGRRCEDRPAAEAARSIGAHDKLSCCSHQEPAQDGPVLFRRKGNRAALKEELRRPRLENQRLRMESEI